MFPYQNSLNSCQRIWEIVAIVKDLKENHFGHFTDKEQKEKMLEFTDVIMGTAAALAGLVHKNTTLPWE